MPETIDSKTTSDAYTDSCTISGVYGSSGGYFSVNGADVYMELLYGEQGTQQETREFHVAQGPGSLLSNTSGVRFRSYKTGVPATVSAGIFYPSEPAITLNGSGVLTVANNQITGIVLHDGTIGGGTGFTVVHTGTGLYTITYTTPFSSTPVVSLTALYTGVIVSMATGQGYPSTATGCTVALLDDGGNYYLDSAFNFTVTPTV